MPFSLPGSVSAGQPILASWGVDVHDTLDYLQDRFSTVYAIGHKHAGGTDDGALIPSTGIKTNWSELTTSAQSTVGAWGSNNTDPGLSQPGVGNFTLAGGITSFFPRQQLLITGNASGFTYTWGWTGPTTVTLPISSYGPSLDVDLFLSITNLNGLIGSLEAKIFNYYMTTSGEILWLWQLRHRATGAIAMTLISPDHPAYGNSGNEDMQPHPFPGHDPALYEVLCVQITADEQGVWEPIAHEINELSISEGLSAGSVIANLFEVDENSNPHWDNRPVAIEFEHNAPGGLFRRNLEGTPGEPRGAKVIKRGVKKPNNVLLRKLKRKGNGVTIPMGGGNPNA